MKILILGATGMLGHKLFQILNEQYETWGSVRGPKSSYADLEIFTQERIIENLDCFDFENVETVILKLAPDVVVNAAGIIRQLPSGKDPIACLTINSLLPHKLDAICQRIGSRLIQISTDCVFSGTKGNYIETDYPDPEDLYGRSKLLGEVTSPNSVTLRTSIIGRELRWRSSPGLIEWFIGNNNGAVNGFTRAIYSGLPTIALARVVANVVQNYPRLTGLYHVSADPITKYDLLCMVRDAFNLEIEVNQLAEPNSDASLNSEKFRNLTGYSPEPWENMIAEMANDKTPYQRYHKSSQGL